MDVSITGIGTWLPEEIRENNYWPQSFSEGDHLKGDRTFNDFQESSDPVSASITDKHLLAESKDPFLGSKLRRVASNEIGADEAEYRAAIAALKDAKVDAKDVDLILSYSMVPDRVTPPSAPSLANRLGAENARAYGIDAVCATTIAQLEMAKAYIQAGMAKTVLLTQSWLMLKTIPKMHPASPGVGDGASALVVKAGPGLTLCSFYAKTHGEFLKSVLWIRSSNEEEDSPWWVSGGAFRLGSLRPPETKYLMKETVYFGYDTIKNAAEKGGYDPSKLNNVIAVQPRGFVPGAIAERLGLKYEDAPSTFEEIAHLGASGVVFNLLRARELNRLGKGTISGMYAQGAGFNRAAVIVEST